MDLVTRIRALCRQRAITLTELERVCGFGQGAIAKWAYKIPSVARVEKVADYFGVSVDYLLDRTVPAQDASKLSGAYLSLARTAQDSGIAPEDIELLIEAARSIRDKK
ncbi:MAG: helix-turn-helix transcriptional regulator [Clostridiales bacterium]|jgi:transcriptional regulator with XRE-family HTH domain|nr:helix-turn-helix transcriptional regulator [Clostridiales bacterium]